MTTKLDRIAAVNNVKLECANIIRTAFSNIT